MINTNLKGGQFLADGRRESEVRLMLVADQQADTA